MAWAQARWASRSRKVKERKASTLPFVGFLHLRRNALLVVSFTSISDGSFSLTTSFVSITSVTSSSLPTRQTRNRFRLNHIQLQLQVTLTCDSLIYANRIVVIIDKLIAS
ncbi:unnamed protein product [Brassica napus]|uniref:(rape) hypothetical protein n=1 Tax=Brassica napus TaxID=3708 RepID=A0A816UIU5_BRANA|nr:unnamed protein product [Brassica napus]